MVKMKKHPTLGIMVRSDGLILHPGFNRNGAIFQEYWTKGSVTSYGYYKTTIKGKNYFVHRLVAETFIENSENKPFIDHINQDRLNNSVENLRWATVKENACNAKNNLPIGQRTIDYPDTKTYYREWKRRKKESK